jgi:hypothetical protein
MTHSRLSAAESLTGLRARTWIGGQAVEARRLGLKRHEAAYLLELRIRDVRRLIALGELRQASVDDDLIDVDSLARAIERWVATDRLDETSLSMLREIVAGRRQIPVSVMRTRPQRTLRSLRGPDDR